MELMRRLALGFTLILVFAIPTDGIVDLFGLSLVKFAGLLAFGLTVLQIIVGSEVRGTSAFMLLVLLYASWAMFSFLWSPMPVDYFTPAAINSQQSLKAHLYLLFFVLLLFQVIRSGLDIRLVFAAYLLGTLGIVFLLVQGFGAAGATVRQEIQGFDANESAVRISTGIPMAIYLFARCRHRVWRWLALTFIPVALFAIMLTGSRTGAVTMVIGLMGFIPLLWRAGWLVKLSGLALLLALLVGVGSVIPEKTLERLFTTGSELTQGTLNARSITWARAYEEWEQKPWAGHGLGAFRRVINRHNIDYTAHNSFVAISVEQGVTGLLFYLAVIVLALFYAGQLAGEERMLMLSLVLIVTLGQMSLTLHEYLYIWLALLLPVLLYTLEREASAPLTPLTGTATEAVT
ncbi:MAG: O-antigen ligase family protein [Thiolinea sp.]